MSVLVLSLLIVLSATATLADAVVDAVVTNPVEAVKSVLPAGWAIHRVETNTYPSYRPKGNGLAIFLTVHGKVYHKQDYSAVIYIMPTDYQDGGDDPTLGQAQSSPARLVAITDDAKIYLWPGPTAEDWKTMKTDLVTVLISKRK